MNLRQLDTFLWVVALKSFRKTAERLNATQPAVSSRISNLEDELGVKLFERDTGSVRLTTKGQELLPYAEKVLRMAEELRSKAGNKVDMSGVLRLGVSETIVHTWLPEYIKRLHESYPNIDLELTVDVTEKLRDDILGRTLDLAFLLGPISAFSVTNMMLSEFPIKWVCSPELLLNQQGYIPVKEFAKYPILTYARNTRPQTEIFSYFKNLSIEHVNGRVFSSTSLSAIVRMATDGVGIASLPTQVIKKEILAGDLVEVEFDWYPSNLVFTASYSKEPYNSVAEKAAELAQLIALEFGSGQ